MIKIAPTKLKVNPSDRYPTINIRTKTISK